MDGLRVTNRFTGRIIPGAGQVYLMQVIMNNSDGRLIGRKVTNMISGGNLISQNGYQSCSV